MTADLVVYRSRSLRRSQRWAWRLVVAGRSVAVSGEGYTDRAEAVRMARRVTSGYYVNSAVVRQSS